MSSCQLIIAEIGEAIPISSTQEFQSNYLSYIKSSSIDQTELSILNAKGQQIDPTSITDFSPDSRYYLFTKAYQKDSLSTILNTSINSLACQSQISLNPSNLPDVHSSFSVLEANCKLFKGLTHIDIKDTYERMLEFFENYKVFDTTMKLNRIICEKINGNYQYQYCAINSLIKNMNILVDTTDSVRQELKDEYGKLIEMKDNCIKNLYESIEKLKTSELHPKMQSGGKKYLIDVYYEEKKMIQSKDKLVEQFNSLSQRIQEKTNLFLTESNRVLNEKSTSIAEIKFEWSALGSEYEKIFKEAESLPMNIINDLNCEFLQFKKALMKIIDILSTTPNATSPNSTIDEAIDVIKMLKLKYANFSLLGSLQKVLDPMNNHCSKMRKSMEKFPQAINAIYNNFQEIKASFNHLCTEYAQEKKVALNLKDSFSSLKYASYFPQAYQASISEIKRRLVFDRKMQNDVELLNKVYSQECSLRKRFIGQYGKYFPSDFCRILKFYEMTFNAEFKTDEIAELPNLLSEDEEKHIANSLSHLNSSTASTNSNCNNDKEIKKRNKQLNQLQVKLETYTSLLEKFAEDLIAKNYLLKEKTVESENLTKCLNSQYNSQLENCPMCHESSVTSVEYQSYSLFYADLKRKSKEKDLQLNQIEKQYQELIAQVVHIKKTFFIHMNTVISSKNAEMANLSSSYKSRVKNLEDLLLSERIKSAKDINININTIEDNNQYEKQIKEYNRLIAIYQNDANKKQKEIEEEMNRNGVLAKENNALRSSSEENRMTIRQLIESSEKLSKKYSDGAEELISTIKVNSMLQAQNESLMQELVELRNSNLLFSNEVNRLKEMDAGRVSDLQQQKEKYEVMIKEKDAKIEEMIEQGKMILKSSEGHKDNTSLNGVMTKEELIEGKVSKEENDKAVIHYKLIDKGSMCIFVPHSEGVYVCINLSEPISLLNEGDEEDNSFFKCRYVLNMNSLKEELKELTIENSLIIIGTIGDMTPYNKTLHSHILLPSSDSNDTLSQCLIVSLSSINYIIGFPGEDLLFRNYTSPLHMTHS